MCKKILTVALLAGLAFTLAAPIKTQAASASSWSFQAGSELIDKDGVTKMSYQQYKNFDLLKSKKLVTEKNDSTDDYIVTWKSSNEDAVWIDAKNGKARANKFNTFREDTAEVTISAVITNTVTKKQITRSFTVIVNNRAFTNPEPVQPEVTPTVTPEPTTAPVPTESPKQEDTTLEIKDSGSFSCAIKNTALPADWKTNVTAFLNAVDISYDGNRINPDAILAIESVDCVEAGTPAVNAYIRTVNLRINIKSGLNPDWTDASQQVIEEITINHLFKIQ